MFQTKVVRLNLHLHFKIQTIYCTTNCFWENKCRPIWVLCRTGIRRTWTKIIFENFKCTL